METIGRLVVRIVINFLVAVIVGSVFWFVATVFGKELAYFEYIRNVFIIILLIDLVVEIVKGLGDA